MTIQPKENGIPVPAPVKSTPLPGMSMGSRGIIIGNLRDLIDLASMVINAGWAPKSLVDGKDGKQALASVCMAIQTGLELGITPTQAISGIAVVNGKPCVYGDLGVALIQGSGLLEEWEEWWEVDGKRVDRAPTVAKRDEYPDSLTAVCRLRRKGERAYYVGAFSVGQARVAKLWGKVGPWQDYSLRMLRWRSVSWACRDGFADVLKGLTFREEAMDIIDPPPRVVTATMEEILPSEVQPAHADPGAIAATLRREALTLLDQAQEPQPTTTAKPAAAKQGALIDEIAPQVEHDMEPGSRG